MITKLFRATRGASTNEAVPRRDVERGPTGILFIFFVVALVAVIGVGKALFFSPAAAKAERAAQSSLPVIGGATPTPYYVVVTATPAPPTPTPYVVTVVETVIVPDMAACPAVEAACEVEYVREVVEVPVEVPVTVTVASLVTPVPVPLVAGSVEVCVRAQGVHEVFIDGRGVVADVPGCVVLAVPVGASIIPVQINR